MKKYNAGAIATNGDTMEITDKRGFGKRWDFSIRFVDNMIAAGLPHLKIGARRVRIVVSEADKWMMERYGTQRNGVIKRDKSKK